MSNMTSPSLYYQPAQSPILKLNLPCSPLLSDAFSVGLCDFASQGISKPLPCLSFASTSTAKPTSYTARLQLLAQHQRQYALPSTSPRNKPLPSLPPPTIPPRQIISLLELLDRMDNDVAKEVHRVRQGIADACSMVREYAQAEQARMAEWQKRKDRDNKDTKEVDDDFWLNA